MNQVPFNELKFENQHNKYTGINTWIVKGQNEPAAAMIESLGFANDAVFKLTTTNLAGQVNVATYWTLRGAKSAVRVWNRNVNAAIARRQAQARISRFAQMIGL